tara:strand:- start:39 stop:521 length:483 start_codon:yes stop_codon:yes gene_type:complete
MAKVAVVIGSMSDWDEMKKACEVLEDLGIEYDRQVLSAHRTPLAMADYAKKAKDNGFSVIIAGAGMAAHLPGVFASLTPLPVIGVPMKGNSVGGLDALLSIAQMPKGVPVATVAIGNATNAGLLAAEIIGLFEQPVQDKIIAMRAAREEAIIRTNADWNS